MVWDKLITQITTSFKVNQPTDHRVHLEDGCLSNINQDDQPDDQTTDGGQITIM